MNVPLLRQHLKALMWSDETLKTEMLKRNGAIRSGPNAVEDPEPGTISPRTVDNLLAGKPIRTDTFRRLIYVVNLAYSKNPTLRPPGRRTSGPQAILPEQLLLPDGVRPNSEPPRDGTPRPRSSVEGSRVRVFENQKESHDFLEAWAIKNQPKKAAVIDYSSHQIKGFVIRLLRKLPQLEIFLFLHTAASARKFGSQHQAFLLETQTSEFISESPLERAQQEGRLHLVFYNVPPSLFGVCFDQKLVACGLHVWLPTFYDRQLTAEKRRKIVELYHPVTTPSIQETTDSLTLNSHDMPQIIMEADSRFTDGGKEFCDVKNKVDLLLSAYEEYYHEAWSNEEFQAMRTIAYLPDRRKKQPRFPRWSNRENA